MTDQQSIRLLPDELINKIAAGEVIERPANIVKELVENSLDAKAKHITIRLKNGGKDHISIEDDGTGIADPATAIERHATSKVYTEQDLSTISTLGFRGEALASICAIAKVEIASKTKTQHHGTRIVIENGKILKTTTVAMDTGTTISVSDVFYNTPARKKFLKSTAVERRHCQDIVTKLSFCDTNVDIKLLHEGSELLHARPHGDLKQRVASVYGVEVAKSMIAIKLETGSYEVSGIIGIPYGTRKDRSRQVSLINDRPVKVPVIDQAVYDAYQSLRFLEEHPVFIISVRLDPTLVDVNVHPTKQVVRLSLEDELERAVFDACTNALETSDLTPSVNASASVKLDDQESKLQSTKQSDLHNTPSYNQTQLQKEPQLQEQTESEQRQNENKGMRPAQDCRVDEDLRDEKSRINEPAFEQNPDENLHKQEDDCQEAETTPLTSTQQTTTSETREKDSTSTSKHHDLGIVRIYGQFTKVYILAATRQGLVIIDQHAAEERVLYEEFLAQFESRTVPSQQLFTPLIIEVSPLQMEEYTTNKDVFEKAGFRIDEFGESELKVSAIPELFGSIDQRFFSEVLDQFNLVRKGKVTSSQLSMIATKACKAAVKAGEELSTMQISDLINRMEHSKRPFTCPHGRPTIITITPSELEKMFKRRA